MKESLGEFIKRIRLERNLDIKDICLQLDLTEDQYLSIEENNNVDLPLSKYLTLAKILGIRFEQISKRIEESLQ
jgi:transcriptional regulator with XRE-family HTH domain